jgi:hypothetical protein
LYFKTRNNSVSYGFIQCPSELIDIPISTFNDFKIKKIKFNKDIQQYQNIILNKTLKFYSYSIYGLIDDICTALFIENEYPWIDVKFEKKINRLIFFFLIYLNNSYQNYSEITQQILNFFEDYSIVNSTNIEYKKYNNSVEKEDLIYNNILGYIADLKKKIILSDNSNNKEKFDKIKKSFIENINNFLPEHIKSQTNTNNIESVPYLKKYLKYKQKYINLKKI